MSSSGSSSDDDDDDEALERECVRLRSVIAADPNAYESYLQLIAAQRKTGDLDGVRAAREQMAGVFHVQLLRVVAERHHQQSLEVAVHHVRHVLTGYRCRCHHLWLA